VEFSKTAKTWNLLPEEIKMLREFMDSREYRLLQEMEKIIKEGAETTLAFATDVNDICRAQGILRGFRLRDGNLQMIFDQTEEEKEEIK